MMLNFLMTLIFLFFLMLFSFKTYFLMILISMEFGVLVMLMIILEFMVLNDWLFLFYLVFSVCESIIGISLMISLIYMTGTQGVKMLNLMW